MTAAQRTATIGAVFEVARARIAVERAARDEALAAYGQALALLPRGSGLVRLEAFASDLEAEKTAYAARPSIAPAAPVAAVEALVYYDVRDLVGAMEWLGFPRVELVGPEGVREELREVVLGGQLYSLLPAEDGPITERHVRELDARNGILILRASAPRHAAMNTYLSTLRVAWPALWPEAVPPTQPPSPQSAAPTAGAAVIEIYNVADLVGALEALKGQVDVGFEEETPIERLRSTLCEIAAKAAAGDDGPALPELIEVSGGNLVVKAPRAAQDAITGLLGAWRTSWRARWPEAFQAPSRAAPAPAPSGLVDLDAVE